MKGVFALAILALVTPPLMAVQWLAVRLRSPLADRVPILFHRLICRLIGLRITLTGEVVRERPLLIVANHASWLDITVLSAVAPVAFVAKSEIARWPLFGTFARLQRCVFVERERRTRTGATAQEMAARLAAGIPVVLFAEGTASDGNRVLPFRTALLGAAVQAAGEEAGLIQPVAIAYRGRHGLPMARGERGAVAWYGRMNLLPHLWGVFSGPPVDVSLSFGAPVRLLARTERKRVASELEAAVRAMFADAMRGRPPARSAGPAPAGSAGPAGDMPLQAVQDPRNPVMTDA